MIKTTVEAINALVEEATQIAEAAGWHEEPLDIPKALLLIHSEVSEATEDYRTSADDDGLRFTRIRPGDGKPEGFPSELADIVIRVAHLAGRARIDLGAAIEEKMAFNRTRPHRHGGKRI